MSDAAHSRFVSIRFAANDGEPFCPHCGNLKVYTLVEIPVRWKRAGCRRKLSVTSGTLFHSRKLPIKDYLAIVFLFVNGVKGKAALHVLRDMNVGPKSMFVLLHKLRECMAPAIGAEELEGEVEIDGAYFGSRTRPENRRADRRQQRRPERQVVVVARGRGLGQTVAWVVNRESDAVPMIRQNVASGTEVHADEAGAWNILHASYPMKRVNHSMDFKADDGACTNQAESYFSRLRRSEFGIHHRVSGHLLQATPTNARGAKTTAGSRTVRSGVGSSVPLLVAARAPAGPLLAPGAHGVTERPNHIVAGLIAKRRELAGVIAELERQLARHRADLTHVDGVLRVLASDLDPASIKPKRVYRCTRYFERNELSRLCLAAFRIATDSLSVNDLVGRVMAEKGFDSADAILRASIRSQVSAILKRLHRQGTIKTIGTAHAAKWKLADPYSA